MNIRTLKSAGPRSSNHIIPALALAIAAVLAGPASAQAVVTDPGHTILTYAGWIENLISQGEQYAKQIAQ